MPLRGKSNVLNGIDGLLERKEKKLRGAYIDCFSNIVTETPKDKGRAQHNWFLTLNSPSKKVVNPKDKDKTFPESTDYVKTPVSILGKRVFFTNNLPYIERLEYDGWSQQAKTGWVRVSLKNLIKDIRKI